MRSRLVTIAIDDISVQPSRKSTCSMPRAHMWSVNQIEWKPAASQAAARSWSMENGRPIWGWNKPN